MNRARVGLEIRVKVRTGIRVRARVGVGDQAMNRVRFRASTIVCA